MCVYDAPCTQTLQTVGKRRGARQSKGVCVLRVGEWVVGNSVLSLLKRQATSHRHVSRRASQPASHPPTFSAGVEPLHRHTLQAVWLAIDAQRGAGARLRRMQQGVIAAGQAHQGGQQQQGS